MKTFTIVSQLIEWPANNGAPIDVEITLNARTAKPIRADGADGFYEFIRDEAGVEIYRHYVAGYGIKEYRR